MKLKIGIYNLHMQAMGGGEKLTLVLAEHLSLTHDVYLFSGEPPNVSLLQQFFGVDLSRVNFVPLKMNDSISRVITKVRNNAPVTLPHPHFRKLQEFNLDLFINNSFASDLKCPAPIGIFMCMFPHPLTQTRIIDSYSQIVAISRYTAHWVRELWKRDAEVIYPPCDDMGPPATKEKTILHVGRFLADSDDDERQHKGQSVLLKAFEGLSSLYDRGWQLHFVGSVAPDRRSAEFAKTIKHSALGLPVLFHLDATSDVIRDLYRKASIFWLATGYGSSECDHPAKQEHFGIATGEAMSAGVIPIVYASGGPREIVTDGVNGYLWEKVDELTSKTLELINDRALRERLSKEAIRSSKRFGRSNFVASIDRLVGSLTS